MATQDRVFEQHAVPQNISSYQFRLIGDMTIKQFFQLAGGTLIAILFYASPLPGFLKWPFIIFFTLAGAALAFLPLHERPLEQWVVAFFRAVYSPTRFVWQKRENPIQYFQQDTASQVASDKNQKPTKPIEEEPKPGFLQNLEDTEKQFLNSFSNLFNLPGTSITKPKESEAINLQPQVIIPFQKTITPEQTAVQIDNKNKGFEVVANNNLKLQPEALSETLPQQTDNTQTLAAQFSPAAAPPMPPTQPNVIVGQVMDKDKNIIEGAILEIKDPMGRPVRALKTNKAGHFLIVTPLNKGTYKIEIEKENYKFDPITVEAKGEIIPPIAIQAKIKNK